MPVDDAVKGQLLPVAARLVMKLMLLFPTARLDVTFAVNTLAKHITIWSVNGDRRAARLLGYLSTTVDLAHVMAINDPLDELHIALYCGADFAGGSKAMKSTSGYVIAFFEHIQFGSPVMGESQTKRDNRSTIESEFVSLSGALFSEGLPLLLELWQVIHPPMFLRILEDNSAVIAIISKVFPRNFVTCECCFHRRGGEQQRRRADSACSST